MVYKAKRFALFIMYTKVGRSKTQELMDRVITSKILYRVDLKELLKYFADFRVN